MKKLLSILLVVSMVFVVFAGCGETKPAETATPTATPSAATQPDATPEIKPATLSFVTWNGAQEESLKAAIAGFNKLYPQITVNLQVIPWGEYWTKLEAAATSGDMPDVITNHVIYSQVYAQADMLLPLDEADLKKYDPNFSYSNYPEGITALYNFDGVNYGVPKDSDCIVLVYNKEIFDKAKLSYPDASWTWDNLLDAAKKLNDPANGVYGFASYNNIQEGYGSLLYQNGGYILSPDKKSSGLDLPGSIEAMQFYMDMMNVHKVSPTTAQLAETDRRAMFASGKLAMLFAGNWQLNSFVLNKDIADKFDIAPLPTKNGSKATISNGLAHSISKTTKSVDAAKLLVAYLGSEEGMKLTAIGPAVPVFKGVDQVWGDLHKDQFNTSVVSDGIKNGVQYPATLTRQKWEAAINVYIEKIFNGEISVEEGFKKAAQEMNEFLSSEE